MTLHRFNSRGFSTRVSAFAVVKAGDSVAGVVACSDTGAGLGAGAVVLTAPSGLTLTVGVAVLLLPCSVLLK